MRLSARIGMVAVALGLAQPVVAEEFEWPARKPGQWELDMKASSDLPAMSMKLCLDAATDKDMMRIGMGAAKSLCPDQKIQRDGDKIVIDGTCEVAGMKVSGRTEITGDFQSEYTMVMKSDISDAPEGVPQQNNLEHRARWVSATCSDGMVPGDMIMPGGIKMNLKSMQGMMDMLGTGAGGQLPSP
jgi:hypothetical protein